MPMCKPILELPKIPEDVEKSAKVCKCRPTCPSRRREWDGVMQYTSNELLLQRNPSPGSVKPKKKQSPRAAKMKQKIEVEQLQVEEEQVPQQRVVVLCQAPLDVDVDTTYLRYLHIAKKIGAWQTVARMRKGFCSCATCCTCNHTNYVPRDTENLKHIKAAMRAFDSRLRHNAEPDKNMYDILPTLRARKCGGRTTVAK